MECSEALDLLFAAFDGQITPTQQALLDGHRRTCFACANQLNKAERFQELLRRVPQLSVPRGLEQRVINRVLAHSGIAATPAARVRSLAEFTRRKWSAKNAFAMGGVLAAALAIFFVGRTALEQLTFHRPVHETITAMVQGSVQAETPNHKTLSVTESQTEVSTGDTLSNDDAHPAIVALAPHLAVTIAGFTQVHFDKLHTDPRTGDPDVVNLKIDHGTVKVHEDLHREVSPIHVATSEATVVPVGTTFAVSHIPGLTRVSVAQGSVAVYTTGRTFNVLAGQGVRILAGGGVLRDEPAVKQPIKRVTPHAKKTT